MGKIILICGKICSGKSYYAERLSKQESAVILSCDEIAFDLSLNTIKDSGEHDAMMDRIAGYLYRKAAEIAGYGANVILDFGFWRKNTRESVSEYFKKRNIPFEWHYIDISDADWEINIEKRNQLVLENKVNAYFMDEGLLSKLLLQFDKPSKDEIDVWFVNNTEME
jgi:predicted kinase